LKYLIAGLGNIGDEYAHTRHNIGFDVLDAFAKASNTCFLDVRYASNVEVKYKGRTLVLIKPTTYMNLSGRAIHYWMQKERITSENLLIIVDDLALPFGTLRLRSKGSDGGHNGLKNINEVLGHQNYSRLRFGIGDNFNKGKQIDFVLSKWDKDEQQQLLPRIELACDIIKSFSTIGIDRTMSYFNGK
jgi:peptidyl-tRNA hydrolase, PTH1 family